MKYKLSEHKDEIITHIIKNSIWALIVTIIPMIIALTKSISKDINENKAFLSSESLWIILSIVVMIIIYLLLKIFLLDRYLSQKEELHKTKNDLLFSKFRAKTMEAELYFENRETLNSKITYKMNVLSTNPINKIERTITWTGSEYVETTISNSNGDYSIIDSKRKFSPHIIKILFNSEKSNGDFVRFSTNTKVLDTNHEMSPHYSFMVKYQIDELVLHVVAPINLITNVNKAVYADVAKEIVVEKPKKIQGEIIGNFIRYTYRIPTPTFLYNYFIEWEFTN